MQKRSSNIRNFTNSHARRTYNLHSNNLVGNTSTIRREISNDHKGFSKVPPEATKNDQTKTQSRPDPAI